MTDMRTPFLRRQHVLQDIELERLRQIEKWGERHHPDGTGEEYKAQADDMRDRCEAAFDAYEGTWLHILGEEFFEAAAEDDYDKLRTELIHIAAVAVSWVEDIDRRTT